MTQLAIEQTFHLAVQHHQAGRLAQAETLYRQILAQQPNHPDALHLLGVLAAAVHRQELAAELIGRAISIQPNIADYHSNLGVVLYELGRLNDAIASFRRALALKPAYPEAHNNLGNALREAGRWQEAIASCRRALALKPEYPEARNNLGNALRDDGQLDEAIACYRRALSLKPDYAGAYNNLGNALRDTGQMTEAIAAYQQAVTLNPAHIVAHSNLIHTLYLMPGYDAPAILREHLAWSQQHAASLRTFIQPHVNDRTAERRLRVGYVSPDFRMNVVGLNILPLLGRHDHGQFEIVCYSNVSSPDAATARFKSYADGWRDIVGVSDARAVEQIRADKIDVLVDLALHSAGNRLLIFAHKPAPVQVTFAGYPGTTGLAAIDYRLTDPYLDPVGASDAFHSEQSVRLPESFWCYEPWGERPEINPLPASTNGFITFGCLNNFCKINEPVLKLWARVLRAVPESRLLLLASEGSLRQRMLAMLQQEGIEPKRVEFVSRQPRELYLQLYHRIDIGLDTFPYNGHTTSLDSFWMGVPVVTLVGPSAVARAGWSQLNNLGLTELAAKDAEEFVRIAVELAGDLPRLKELRSSLRPRMEKSPLMDGGRFARNIEAAYRQMWRRWCEIAGNAC